MGAIGASFFACEILEQPSRVDAAVAGEGKRPLAEVAAAVRKGRAGDRSAVPSLLWRRNGGIEANAARHVADAADLNAMNFGNFALMDQAAEYGRLPKSLTRLHAPRLLAWRRPKALSQQARVSVHALVMERGCGTNGSCGGGGAIAHRGLNGRTKVLFRSLGNAVGAFRKLAAAGFRGACLSFNPVPASQTDDPARFERLRRDGRRARLTFSAWAIPSPEYIEGFAAAFEPGARILLSPETGSERLRRTVRGTWYYDGDLLAALRRMDDFGIASEVCFSLGLPGMARRFRCDAPPERHRGTLLRPGVGFGVSGRIEPVALWFQHSDRFEIMLLRGSCRTFSRSRGSPAIRR